MLVNLVCLCAPCSTAVAKDQVATATSAAEVAEARLKSTQEQLGKANDAAVTAQDQVYQLQAEVEVRKGFVNKVGGVDCSLALL